MTATTGTATMQAGVIAAPRMGSVAAVPLRAPAAGEVRIRLEGSGVCGSNLPVWEGRPWFEYPLAPGAPGHEGWGVVETVGPGVATLAPGDRVASLGSHAFAEYDVVPAEACVRLPDALAGQAFPGEPLGCAVNVFRRASISADDTVVIVGIGFLGAVVTRLASHAGARVIAVSRRRFALDVARRQGAEVTLPLEQADEVATTVEQLTGGRGADHVIEAVGLQGPLDLASRLVRVRGRLVIAGYHQDGLRQVDMQSWNWRGIDVISAHERDLDVYRAGIEGAIAAVEDGTLAPDALYTHCYRLSQLTDALDVMRRRPDGFLKALVLT